jgi:hypothetical protein
MAMKMQDSTATFNNFGNLWNSTTTAGVAGTGTTINSYAWGYQTALITTLNTGTVSAGTITWEGFDGYNWYVIPTTLITTAATVATTYTLTTGSAGFYCNINGFNSFRTRLSVAIGGSGTVFVNMNLSAASSIAV